MAEQLAETQKLVMDALRDGRLVRITTAATHEFGRRVWVNTLVAKRLEQKGLVRIVNMPGDHSRRVELVGGRNR